jgi:hypothetical protein
MSTTVPVTRGCGRRVQGGVYAECGLSPYGQPLEHFIIDPPVAVPKDLNLAVQGIDWIERGGVWHVLDWIGANHYPNVTDFLEEVRRFGLSRRIPRTEDFSRLTPDSRIVCVHGRAILDAKALATIYRPGENAPYVCPKALVFDPLPEWVIVHQGGGAEMCAGVWWQDVIQGTKDPTALDPRVKRELPSFSYMAWASPDAADVDYTPGMFASFPISNLVVVKAADGSHAAATEKASKAHLPVEEVPE